VHVVEHERDCAAETFIVPHSLCELAEVSCSVVKHPASRVQIALKRRDHAAMTRYVKSARAYKHYDFDKPLIRRLFALSSVSPDIAHVD
jgi:hypothetical protein